MGQAFSSRRANSLTSLSLVIIARTSKVPLAKLFNLISRWERIRFIHAIEIFDYLFNNIWDAKFARESLELAFIKAPLFKEGNDIKQFS